METYLEEFLQLHKELLVRGLKKSVKWCVEILAANANSETFSIRSRPINLFPSRSDVVKAEVSQYFLAKAYFDLEEYDRAAFVLKSSSSPLCEFLHLYSRFLAADKRFVSNSHNFSVIPGESSSYRDPNYKQFSEIYTELKPKFDKDQLGGYSSWVFGCLSKRLGLVDEAVAAFIKAVKLEPLNWAAWNDLSQLMPSRDTLIEAELPNCLLKKFFLVLCFLHLQLPNEAASALDELYALGFKETTPWFRNQKAMILLALRDTLGATQELKTIFTEDPYRLDQVDAYSNMLYVQERRQELAYLAHKCVEIDKYRPETCCVVANYYSLRGDKEKAILYFQRALKLDPNYHSAWTLMGHEYVEIKNTSAAVHAYRSMLDINKNDYRAWYGLGQVFEILMQHSFSLYYFQKAQNLRPYDSRMLVALGDAYSKMELTHEAKKCYWHAHATGDSEGSALMKLGKLFKQLGELDQAAAAFTQFANEVVDLRPGCYTDRDLSEMYIFLAEFHRDNSNFDEAAFAAQKCIHYPESREQGKVLLSCIARLRAITNIKQDTVLLSLTDEDPGL